MTAALVVRIVAADGARPRVVPIGPGQLLEAEVWRDRIAAELESVRVGRRRVEIVPAEQVSR